MVSLDARYERYRQRYNEAHEARNLTNEEVAERAGAHPMTINKLRTGRMNMSDKWRARLAEALRMDEAVLYGEEPLPEPAPEDMFLSPAKAARKKLRKAVADNDNQMLPVYGRAAGSRQGEHSEGSERIDEVPCPPGLIGVWGAYVLQTNGDSMMPRYFPKDRLYINPNQPVHPGDHVIIQVRINDSSGTETWVKRFDAMDTENIYVTQYNPPTRITYKRRYVAHIHRVLPVNELFP